MKDTPPFVLLGAGASVPAGIPTATRMTEVMLASDPYASDPLPSLLDRQLKVLKFVAGGLAMQEGIEGNNPLSGINVEDLFSAVRMLSNRTDLEISPFVAQWHNTVEEMDDRLEQERPFRQSGLEDAIEAALGAAASASSSSGRSRGFRSAARNLRKELDKYFTETGSRRYEDVFEETSESMVKALTNLVWIEDSSKVDYHRPLVQTAEDQKLTIATLNYDNTVELSAEKLEVNLKIGLEDWSRDGYFTEPQSGIELLKLHGSIDWVEKSERPPPGEDEEPEILFPSKEISRLDPDQSANQNRNPALIFGAGNKLTEEGPFIELFRTFEERLDNHSTLVVIGYSFSDEHINHVIRRWMNQDIDRKLIIIDRPGVEKEDHPFWEKHRRLQETDRVELRAVGAKQGIRNLFED